MPYLYQYIQLQFVTIFYFVVNVNAILMTISFIFDSLIQIIFPIFFRTKIKKQKISIFAILKLYIKLNNLTTQLIHLINNYRIQYNIQRFKNNITLTEHSQKITQRYSHPQINKMSFKASIDMFVNFSYIQVRFLNRQGFLRYRMKIYMKYQDQQSKCHPYNIVKGPTKQQSNKSISSYSSFGSQYETNSQIDTDTSYYYSRIIPVEYRPGNYQENQTVFFKAYVQTEIIQEVQFYCTIQCLFSQVINQKMEVVGKFQARIRKVNDISTFLPVVFDVFQGFMIFSTFHSTVLEFKYSQDDFQSIICKKVQKIPKYCYDFYSYVNFLTEKFDREKLNEFYCHYRDFLQQEHQALQNRHEQLIAKLAKQTKQKNQLLTNGISYVKIIKNSELIKLIAGDNKSIINKYQNNDNNSNIPLITPEQSQQIVQLMLKDFSIMKSCIYKKWMEFAKIVMHYSKIIAKFYRKQYQNLCKERFKNNVFSHKIKNHDWRVAKYSDSGKTNLQQAFTVKRKKSIQEQQLWKQHFPIQNLAYFGSSQTNIKIFQQIYLTDSNKSSQFKHKARHIIILVHGFQASRQDFVLMKNCLQVVYGVQVVISTCNQGLTDGSIVAAGKRLGMEVKKILSTFSGEYKLSFVGHSMGGLIIRSAMPEIAHLRDRFYTFMSFSSPHLGYLYQTSTLIKAGLWILTSFHKIQAITEMTMKDNEDLRQTMLYQLSKNDSLKHFKKLCFVCSSLDQYVPYQSARIQQNQSLMQQSLDKNTQTIIREMVDGMIGYVDAPQISRINVVFNIQDKNFDSFLGRTGHVKFLSDVQFIREFCSCFDKFFA